MRVFTTMLLAVWLSGSIVAPSLAQVKSNAEESEASREATKLLDGNGLRKQGTTYLVPAEADFSKLSRTKDLQALKRAVSDSQAALDETLALEELRKLRIEECTQRAAQLAVQLNNTTSGAARNNVLVQHNANNALLVQLHKGTVDGVDVEQAIGAARTSAATAREAFVDHVLKMRATADEIARGYQELESDAQITKALDELSAATGKKFALGPSTAYKRNVAELTKLESGLLSESIKLRREGQTLYVGVVVGGKPPREFVVDTGASTISLPWKLATQLDLRPTESDPTVRCSLADGRVVEARLVIAKSVRVGKFTVENVECTVLPAELTNAPPLLGMTFLGNYNCRLNTEAGTMTLTKVSVPGAPTAKRKPAK